MRYRAGTSGFAYKAWKGSFYPEKCRPEEMLPFYASRFDAVEINNTFYRMPSESVLARWIEQVPPNFHFVLKASQRITHHRRLKEVADEVAYFCKVASVLGAHRGPTLFQLPPNLKKDIERLRVFLDLLPRGWQAAMEFRHESWFDDEVFDMLSGSGVALCHADEEVRQSPWVATTSYGYLRLRREEYSEGDLVAYAKRVKAEQWDHVYVFFKHEDAGVGPRLAEAFLAALGKKGGSDSD